MRTTSLSAYQYRFWLEWQLNPHSSAYTTALVYRLSGPLDRDALRRALDAFVHEHDEGCRSTFRMDDARVVRDVHDRVTVALDYRDARAAPVLDAAEADAWIAARAAHVFALDHSPLFRFALLREDADAHRLVLSFPHIISDAFSAVYINQRLTALYNHALGAGPAPASTLRDFGEQLAFEAGYRASPRYDEDLAYWLGALAHAPLGVEFDAAASAGPREGRIHRMRFDADTTRRLRARARASRSTPFLVLSSLFAIALARWQDVRELVVTYPVNMRSPGFREASGCFVNNLPMGFSLRQGDTFRDIVARTTARRAQSKHHQQLSLTDLVTALRRTRSLADTPVFNVGVTEAFFVQDAPLAFQGVHAELLPVVAAERPFDLNFAYQLTPDGLHVNLEYDTGCLPPARIGEFAARFGRLLRAYLDDDAQPALAVDLLAPEQRARLAHYWHGPARTIDATDWPARFAAQCAATPDAPAVRFGAEQLTYRELDALSARLAGFLAARGVTPGALVGLCCERSTEMVVAILAVMRAGAAYVPLDPAAPPDRLRRIVDDAGLALLLTQRHLLARLPAGPVARHALDERATWLAAEPLPQQRIHPDGIAYVIYTSGSTGTPKGVANTHRALVNRLDWHGSLLADAEPVRVLQKTPYFFDVSVWEFLWTLQSGHALVIAPPELHKDPAGLAVLLRDARIAVAHFVPSMLNAFLDAAPGQIFPDLALVVCSGEALLAEQAERFHRLLPGVRLANLYGPTEAAIDVTVWHCEPGEAHARAGVPIGRPIDNVSLYVLDAGLEPCAPGSAGELYIGGAGLAQGYVGRPDLTAASFVPDPYAGRPGARMYRTGDIAMFGEHGELHYLGRRDEQVKLNGNRIELREIEACLLALPGIAQCAVVPVRVQGRVRLLHAFVEPAAGWDSWPADALHAELAARLPDAMRPARIDVVERIALLPAGKIDRKRLAQLADAALETRARGAEVRAKTPFQAEVAAEWSAVLDVADIGPDDQFFMLGGSSVQAIQLIGRLNGRYGLLLSPPLLFGAPQLDRFSAQVLVALGQKAQQEDRLEALLERLAPDDMDELLTVFSSSGELV
ncbi:MAG: amino acid adenylation domain-containing protein [Burkholderia sp.]|jgi:amino acid adenylation domain-containing protein|nr:MULTISPECIES: non-ribosomal peptide synthetase [Burkholderia]MCA3781734.1 amino acid adenylation domain-containing protein [Burkholderia sp.]MCA3785984.1 amino acid adenylation domain-containing protein [Burkholderia sp.]MCA3791462.1 amino acid adenylation domain-containing protein [Burkholderia sp.]MCA3808807.1 amino acid adenylation domain-containing protein [Burkholderia sp.]MCA3815669.1 amino acid adenylation domain-containing protein [Burkholderia sp.]